MAMAGASRARSQGLKDAQQKLVSLVSAFRAQWDLVLGLKWFQNQHHSEIARVQTLPQVLKLAGVVFDLDALQAQKNALADFGGGAITT